VNSGIAPGKAANYLICVVDALRDACLCAYAASTGPKYLYGPALVNERSAQTRERSYDGIPRTVSTEANWVRVARDRDAIETVLAGG
jgi:hypothetical protein